MMRKNRPMNFQRGNKRPHGGSHGGSHGGGGNGGGGFRRHRRFGQRQGARVYEGKTKPQALQMRDKFQHLAREAQMAGDRVQMEYYLQHADHYTRIVDYFEAQEREEAASYENEAASEDASVEDMDAEEAETTTSAPEASAVTTPAPSAHIPALGLPLPPAFPSFRAPESIANSSDEDAPSTEEAPTTERRAYRPRAPYQRRNDGDAPPRERRERRPRTEEPSE